jgi:lipoyl(octanoyl) transferase
MLVKFLGTVPYLETQIAMQEFVASSNDDTEDEIWLLEHPAVYTQGTACDMQTFIPSDIPIVKSDRGGQITYHGMGQIIMYTLINLKRSHLGVKALVELLEQAVIELLSGYKLRATRKEGAPGVYINDAKIAALGLRVRKGFSYHGLSLNVKMDLSPFDNIDPCGYQGLKVTHLASFNNQIAIDVVQQGLLDNFQKLLNSREA